MAEDLHGSESWRLFRILSEFTEGIDRLEGIRWAVSIFGSARTPPSSKYYQAAHEIAHKLGEEGISVITGGGPGIMEAGSKGAFESQSKSIGLNIELPHEQTPNPYQDIQMHFRYFFVRKVMFVKYSIGYICMPGGFGTLDELLEAMTLMQTHKVFPIPIILYGEEFWAGLMEWLEAVLVAEGTITREDLSIIQLTDDIDFIVDTMAEQARKKDLFIRQSNSRDT